MHLLDDLKNLLARHKQQLETEVNQGAVRLIDEHLKQLEAVAEAGEAAAEAEVHKVLADLYGRLNVPVPTPAPAPAPVPVETAPVPEAPVADPAPEPEAAPDADAPQS